MLVLIVAPLSLLLVALNPLALQPLYQTHLAPGPLALSLSVPGGSFPVGPGQACFNSRLDFRQELRANKYWVLYNYIR